MARVSGEGDPLVAAGTIREPALDRRGRTLVTPYAVRSLVSTAHASLTRGQEGEVLAGDSDEFLDVITLGASNSSTAAVTVNIRSGTGNANHMDVLSIPAGSTVTRNYEVPLKQSEVDSSWTAQLDDADASDSPVTVTIQAIRHQT